MGEKKRKKREGRNPPAQTSIGESQAGGLANPKSGESGKQKARDGRQSSKRGSKEGGSMADSTNARCKERESEGQLAKDASDRNKRKRPKIKSELGGTVDVGVKGIGVDANTNRVDRLRLLGNGVVPQTAAKAFSTLSMRLVDHLKP